MKTLFVVLVVVLLASGCSMKSEHRAQINGAAIQCPEGTPPGEQCVVEYRGPTHLMGGGRTSALFVKGGECTQRDAEGNSLTVPCGTVTLGAWNSPDRGDTVLPALVGAAGDVLAAHQLRLGTQNAAKKSGPGLVILNENRNLNSSNSNSAAVAQQQTKVDIGIENSSCPSGKCYDPTK